MSAGDVEVWVQKREEKDLALKKRIKQSQFNEEPQNHLFLLICKAYPLVENFFVKSLASELYKTISFKLGIDTKEIDWFFSKKCVCKYLGAKDISEYSEKEIILSTSSILSEGLSLYSLDDKLSFPQKDFSAINNTGAEYWLHYKENLKKLPDNLLISYLDKGEALFQKNIGFYLKGSISEFCAIVKQNPQDFPEEYKKILKIGKNK